MTVGITSNRRVRNLGLVQGDNHSEKSHTETSKKSACHEVGDFGRSRLQSSSNDEDDATNADSPSSTSVFGCRASEHGAEKSAGSEQGYDSTTVIVRRISMEAYGLKTYVLESVGVVLKRS